MQVFRIWARRRRELEDVSITAFVAGTPVSWQTWANWESGRHTPDDKNTLWLVDRFGVTEDNIRQMVRAQKEMYQKSSVAFGRWLKSFRVDQGMSRQEAADAMGVKEDTLRKWENGHIVPGIESAYRIVNWTGTAMPEEMSRTVGWPDDRVRRILGPDAPAPPNRNKVGPGVPPSAVMPNFQWQDR